ncbi:MAG: VOC family protein [Marinilabiliales bacterium]|nr:VOC family protein [Marinilabiliales bacterium]
MQIDHVAIWTDNLERLKDFYVRHLGCQATSLYHNPAKRFRSYFLLFREGARLEIMSRDDISHRPEGVQLGMAHFAVRLSSREAVDRFTQSLESLGVAVVGRPRVTGDGCYESCIADPDGSWCRIPDSRMTQCSEIFDKDTHPSKP